VKASGANGRWDKYGRHVGGACRIKTRDGILEDETPLWRDAHALCSDKKRIWVGFAAAVIFSGYDVFEPVEDVDGLQRAVDDVTMSARRHGDGFFSAQTLGEFNHFGDGVYVGAELEEQLLFDFNGGFWREREAVLLVEKLDDSNRGNAT
jgi:hypothetical protein